MILVATDSLTQIAHPDRIYLKTIHVPPEILDYTIAIGSLLID